MTSSIRALVRRWRRGLIAGSVIAVALALPAVLVELLWLLQTGQAVQFVIRLVQFLSK